MSWWLWMLAGAGAGQVASVGAAYRLRGRLQARFAAKLEQQMQAELAKAMPGLAGSGDPAAMLGALLAHAPADALAQTVQPPRLAAELANAVSDPTQAQMRQHSHAYYHLRPFHQDA